MLEFFCYTIKLGDNRNHCGPEYAPNVYEERQVDSSQVL